MLKLATLPRSRRERDWWRATPGRSGKGATLPLPAESPAERAAGCVTRGRRCARANCRGPASQGDPAARASVAPRVSHFAIFFQIFAKVKKNHTRCALNFGP